MFKADLIKYYITATAAALSLGVSKSTVSLWGEVIPWQYALLAEKRTEGALRYNSALYENPTK